jgi:two-component system, OmpR family, phosphate regulon response regulator PhoB
MQEAVLSPSEGFAGAPDDTPYTRSGRRNVQRVRRVLIIERDPDTQRTLQATLSNVGFAVTTVVHAEDGCDAIDRDNPDLVMLDWDLPGAISMDLVHHVRQSNRCKDTRLIALSSFGGEHQVVSGLELGLDGYVIKPFAVGELMARVHAMLRPLETNQRNVDYLEFHRLFMDLTEGRVTVQRNTVVLRAKEFALLECLMRHPERAFNREQLLSRVWARNGGAEARAVDVTIQRIRKALVPHGCDRYLQTVRGFGYRISIADLAG